MADQKTTGLTENTNPASTVVFPAMSSDGLTDYRVPYSVFTAAITAAVAALINSAPGALDTLDELAAAFGDDANFAATVTDALALKQPIDTDLTAIAALVSAADKFPYATGAGTWTLGDITSAARTFLASPTAANVPITDSAGDFTATDVEGALAELQTFDETLRTAEAGEGTSVDVGTVGFISTDLTILTKTVGQYYFSNYSQTSVTGSALTQDRLYFHPILLPAGTIDRIGVDCGTGVASLVARLGIYGSSGDMVGTLIAEATSTADLSTSATVRDLTISAVIPTMGLYWFAIVCQGAAPGTGSVRQSTSQTCLQPMPFSTTVPASSATGGMGGRFTAGVTGALPSNPAASNTAIATLPTRFHYRWSA